MLCDKSFVFGPSGGSFSNNLSTLFEKIYRQNGNTHFSLIMSDKAKTFKRTEKELQTLYRHPEIIAELENRRIEWRFNLERAPWWGGFFERMVGSVKRCLQKVIGNARLTFDELLTVLVEVEGTLSSRPLTYEYNNPEGEVLTPAHLIYGRRLQSLPEVTEEEDESESTCARRYKYLNQKLQHFWKRWQREYLTDLREPQDARFFQPKVT